LIPQARHGGMGNVGLAFPASNPTGTGFEKEQIGQIQVPCDILGVGADTFGLKGLLVRETGDDGEDSRGEDGPAGS
jgi:hypothetical protein